MNLNYDAMSHQDVYPAIEAWQDKIDVERASVEKKGRRALAEWQGSVQEAVVESWWNMSDFLIMKYNDGRVNSPVVGASPGYPQWFADMVGFGNDVHPLWVQPARAPAPEVAANLTGYVQPLVQLPTDFDFVTSSWSFRHKPAVCDLGSASLAEQSQAAGFSSLRALGTLATLGAGAALGITLDRWRCGRVERVAAGEAGTAAYLPLA